MNKVTKYFPIMILVGALGGCATRTHTVSTETREVPLKRRWLRQSRKQPKPAMNPAAY